MRPEQLRDAIKEANWARVTVEGLTHEPIALLHNALDKARRGVFER